MEWQHYGKVIRKQTAKRTDMIGTEPPHCLQSLFEKGPEVEPIEDADILEFGRF